MIIFMIVSPDYGPICYVMIFFKNYSVLFMYRDWAVIVQSLKGHDCVGTEEPSCCHIPYVLLNQLDELDNDNKS